MANKPTSEQKKIYTVVKKRPEHILIQAYAGAGKTTTLVESVNHMPQNANIIFLAYNKHIQEELKTKLPSHVRCYTSHGLGLAAIKRKYGDSIKMDEFKLDKIIRKKSSRWDLDSEFDSNEDKWKYLNDLKKLTNLCKLSLVLDAKYIPYIADRYEINLKSDRDVKRVLKILDASMNDKTSFDFTDMIFLPAIDNSIWLFPQDYVIVDEYQDINRAQQKMIEKMLKRDRVTKKYTGRLIAAGDMYQTIYGFTGITDKTIDWFLKFPNIKKMTLSTSFRCSKEVIKHANKIVPEIKALESAPDGIVKRGNVVNEADDGDFVLCRTTKPLVKLFFEFLMMGKKAVVKGSDIGLQLIDLIGNISDLDKLNNHWERELSKFRDKLRNDGILNPSEHSGYVALEDKVETLLFLANLSLNITDLIEKINNIFTDSISGIVLSTIHKSKGLEAERVFIIRPDLIPYPFTTKSWQYLQEKNLEYVAITRAKKDLIYDYNWTDEEEDDNK